MRSNGWCSLSGICDLYAIRHQVSNDLREPLIPLVLCVVSHGNHRQ